MPPKVNVQVFYSEEDKRKAGLKIKTPQKKAGATQQKPKATQQKAKTPPKQGRPTKGAAAAAKNKVVKSARKPIQKLNPAPKVVQPKKGSPMQPKNAVSNPAVSRHVGLIRDSVKGSAKFFSGSTLFLRQQLHLTHSNCFSTQPKKGRNKPKNPATNQPQQGKTAKGQAPLLLQNTSSSIPNLNMMTTLRPQSDRSSSYAIALHTAQAVANTQGHPKQRDVSFYEHYIFTYL